MVTRMTALRAMTISSRAPTSDTPSMAGDWFCAATGRGRPLSLRSAFLATARRSWSRNTQGLKKPEKSANSLAFLSHTVFPSPCNEIIMQIALKLAGQLRNPCASLVLVLQRTPKVRFSFGSFQGRAKESLLRLTDTFSLLEPEVESQAPTTRARRAEKLA